MLKVKVVSDSQIMVGGRWWLPGHIHDISEAQLKLTLETYPDSLQVIGQPMALREIIPNVSTELEAAPKKKRG